MLHGGESQDGYGAESDETPGKEHRNADPDVRLNLSDAFTSAQEPDGQ